MEIVFATGRCSTEFAGNLQTSIFPKDIWSQGIPVLQTDMYNRIFYE